MFSPFAGRRLLSRPTAKAGSAYRRACRSRAPCLAQPSSRVWPTPRRVWPALRRVVPAHRVPTAPEHDRRVATMRRQRPPRGSHGLPPFPRARLHLLPPLRPRFRTPALSEAATTAARAALATERRRCLAGDIPLLPRLHSSIPAARSSA